MKIGSRRNIQLDDEGRIIQPAWKFILLMVTIGPLMIMWVLLLPFPDLRDRIDPFLEKLFGGIPTDTCRNGKCGKEFPQREKLVECPWCFADLDEDQRRHQ